MKLFLNLREWSRFHVPHKLLWDPSRDPDMQIRARILNRVLFELYLFPVSLKRAMMKVTMGKIAAILCTRVTFNRDGKKHSILQFT